jgi:hypothetical protein
MVSAPSFPVTNVLVRVAPSFSVISSLPGPALRMLSAETVVLTPLLASMMASDPTMEPEALIV